MAFGGRNGRTGALQNSRNLGKSHLQHCGYVSTDHRGTRRVCAGFERIRTLASRWPPHGLTVPGCHRIILAVSEASHKSSVGQELRLLEQRLDELVTVVTQLKEENRALRQRLDSLMTERATLLQKNEQVRARVEAMIGRLKAMEHGA